MPSLRNSATSSGAERFGPVPATGSTTLERKDYGWLGSFEAMASPCEVHVAVSDPALALRVLEVAEAEARRIERKFSRYRNDSVVTRINRAEGRAVTVDAETARLLNFASDLHALSHGRFDITSGVLRKVWRFDGRGRVPTRAAVENVLSHVGWHRARWREPELRLEPGMEIDFGGIGKEYAVDRAARLAREIAPDCLLNFGGDLVATGAGNRPQGWTVGIEDPATLGRSQTMITLTHGALATSGDTRRCVLDQGKRYGHILDPRTGWPVEHAPRSVTVAAATCTNAGMLATLAMLRGDEAEAFLDAENVRYWCVRQQRV